MSANRSVLAAQRRRAGPTNSEPGIPGRGPQPSINSSQIFANQGKSVPGLKQQQQQQAQPAKPEGLSSVSKMTIPQAITLITLRLGSVESKLMHIQESGGSSFGNNIQMEGQENMILIDKSVIQSITSRLESLEKRSSTSSVSASGPEVNLLKQQIEIIKQSVIQNKTISANLVKNNTDLKNQIENLKSELTETKELLQALQNLTMDNSQKLMSISFNMNNDEMLGQDFDDTTLEQLEQFKEINGIEGIDYNNLVQSSNFTNLEHFNKGDRSEIVTGNLKTMIENEINSSM